MKSIATTRALFSALAIILSSPAFSGAYDITDLGTIDKSVTWSSAMSVNSLGQVVGNSGTRGFIWTNGVMVDLDPARGNGTVNPNGINVAGQVVGVMQSGFQGSRAFSWYNGVITNLGTLGGGTSTAYGINGSGQIAGTSSNIYGTDHAVRWDNGLLTDLGVGWGLAINSLGHVVGNSLGHAALWSNGSMTDLGTLGGISSNALGINDHGQVVGASYTLASSSGNTHHAFIWNNGKMTDLNAPGWLESNAYSINNNGEVLGSFATASGWGLFLWKNGVMTDLSSLLPSASGWTLNTAFSINDPGQIAGTGVINGQTHALLLTPASVPVPAAAWLLGSGLLGLIGVARRNTA